MPFFSAEHIAKAIAVLGSVHPFHGITFLACKRAKLPVGKPTVFAMDQVTDKHLRERHRVDPRSDFFFQPFKSSDREKKWVAPGYPAKGLQAVNTGAFLPAFKHPHGSRIWAWSTDYVEFLRSKLSKGTPLPAYELAVWLYRDTQWIEPLQRARVIATFRFNFEINQTEWEALFDGAGQDDSSPPAAGEYQDRLVDWSELLQHLPPAPDAEPEQGGTLSYLRTAGIGPAHEFVVEPASRLTLITGDNGLGKSFILDAAWWALTGTWAGRPAFPRSQYDSDTAEIEFAIDNGRSKPPRTKIQFDGHAQAWPAPKKRPTIAGLIVYARVDGSFAIWDPARQIGHAEAQRATYFVFSHTQAWDGEKGQIEGLIRDWIRWQSRPGGGEFDTFVRVLEQLSPPDLGRLEPGDPVRVPDDPRDIPTIKHPYGETPILYASAGVRRIITLAYLLVWAWREHLVAAELSRSTPQRRMVVLVDELEAHLHPKWQRAFLPALISLDALLEPSLQAQFIVATHSPLVMASSESVFRDEVDKLLHLDIQSSGEISLEEVDYRAYGDVSAWLTSPVFELRHARSQEGEAAIEAAKRIQLADNPSAASVREVHALLQRHIAADDRFWPRWLGFAERNGVAT